MSRTVCKKKKASFRILIEPPYGRLMGTYRRQREIIMDRIFEI